RRDVDLRRLELILEDQREEEVERALERVEVQLEIPKRRRPGVNLAWRSDALALRDGHLACRRGGRLALPPPRSRGPVVPLREDVPDHACGDPEQRHP